MKETTIQPSRYAHVLRAFHEQPWAILPSKLAEIRHFLHVKAAGGDIEQGEIQAILSARRERDDGVQMAGRVAVVQIFGTICQRASWLSQASGGVGTEQLGATLDGLVADKQVRTIALVFDSPGGAIAGVPELAEKIRGYRGQKNCIGMVNSMAASAAYWLASQCKELSCAPSGMVGSIGVLAAHEDRSAAFLIGGVKTTLIHAGEYKCEGNPFEPLSDDAREEMQAKVDYYYGLFVEDVAKGRGVTAARVKAEYGQGRMLTAAQAKGNGMVDRVCTLEELLDRLGANDDGGTRAAAGGPSLEARRRRLELELED